MRGMLILRRAQLMDSLQDVQAQLERVEAHIHHIETEGEMPQGDVIVKDVEPILVAGRRIRIPVNEGVVLEDLNSAFNEVCESPRTEQSAGASAVRGGTVYRCLVHACRANGG